MIRLIRMDGISLVLNAEWIESVEATPDTVITLTTGRKYLVKETVEQVVEAFKLYKREIHTALPEVTQRSRKAAR